MSLSLNLRNALTRVATEFKTVNNKIAGNNAGSLSGLNTTAKANLVAAINELKSDLALATNGGLSQADVDARIALIVGSAPATLDTLTEIAAAIGNDANFAATMTSSLAYRLRFDAAQSLTAGQRTQGLANLGAAAAAHNHDSQYFTQAQIGDVTTNFVTHFEAGLV